MALHLCDLLFSGQSTLPIGASLFLEEGVGGDGEIEKRAEGVMVCMCVCVCGVCVYVYV